MHQFKVSETVLPGVELQGLAAFLHTSSLQVELEDESSEALDPVRRYMAAIAARLPELIDVASEVLVRHRLEQLERQNLQLQRDLDD